MGTTFIRFVTNHAFVRQMDGRTDTFLVTRPRCMQCVTVLYVEVLILQRSSHYCYNVAVDLLSLINKAFCVSFLRYNVLTHNFEYNKHKKNKIYKSYTYVHDIILSFCLCTCLNYI